MELRKKDRHGEWRYMIDAQGYVMARRPGSAPVIFTMKEWGEMQSPAEYDAMKQAYDAARNVTVDRPPASRQEILDPTRSNNPPPIIP